MNRDFPVSAEDVQQLLEAFQHQRAEEEEDKEKEKNELSVMAQELAVFQQKKRKDLGLPAFSELEKVSRTFLHTCSLP